MLSKYILITHPDDSRTWYYNPRNGLFAGSGYIEAVGTEEALENLNNSIIAVTDVSKYIEMLSSQFNLTIFDFNIKYPNPFKST